MKHLKSIALVVFMFCLAGTAFSQDVILKKDNTTVLSKVLEISSTEIKYKKWSNQDGPTYSINCSEVVTITFQNGNVERFSDTPVVTSAPQQAVVSYPEVQTQAVQPQPEPKEQKEPEKPELPYTRRRVQFSLNGGVAFPLGKFGTTDDELWSAPFAFEGDDLETGYGSAKTGFNASLRLHIPLYKVNKDIVGLPIKLNLLYNGLTDTEKKDYRDYVAAVANAMNEYYGVEAYSYKINKYPNYMNVSLMVGADYTHYFIKQLALFVEGSLGLNIAHITNLELHNNLGETFVYYDGNTNWYSESKKTTKYNPKANFAYEIGAGLFVVNHLSIGIFYTGYSSFSVSSKAIYSGNISDDLIEEYTAPKLQISALSIQLGVHF